VVNCGNVHNGMGILRDITGGFLVTSQYRCETCKYAKINDRITCFCPGKWGKPMLPNIGNGVIGLALIEREIELITAVGCASHSDFHIPIVKYPGCNGICAFEPWEREAIKKEEREKVLDKLLNELLDYTFTCGGSPVITVTNIRYCFDKELRKGGEQK